MDPGRLLLVFDGFDESLVLLFPGAVGRGKRCSPVPLVAACVVVPRVPRASLVLPKWVLEIPGWSW